MSLNRIGKEAARYVQDVEKARGRRLEGTARKRLLAIATGAAVLVDQKDKGYDLEMVVLDIEDVAKEMGERRATDKGAEL